MLSKNNFTWITDPKQHNWINKGIHPAHLQRGSSKQTPFLRQKTCRDFQSLERNITLDTAWIESVAGFKNLLIGKFTYHFPPNSKDASGTICRKRIVERKPYASPPWDHEHSVNSYPVRLGLKFGKHGSSAMFEHVWRNAYRRLEWGSRASTCSLGRARPDLSTMDANLPTSAMVERLPVRIWHTVDVCKFTTNECPGMLTPYSTMKFSMQQR